MRRILLKTLLDRLLSFLIIISLVIKKIASDRADVASIARYLLARIARIGYSKALLF